MNRLTRTIPDPSSKFGASPSKEVFIPRSPEIVKFSGNLAATKRKMRIAEEKNRVQNQFSYITLKFNRAKIQKENYKLVRQLRKIA